MSGWPSLPKKSLSKTGPLWRRTQLRLQNMGTYTAQLTPMSLGLEPVSQAMEQTVDAQAHLLVQLIKRMEERQEENPPGSTAA